MNNQVMSEVRYVLERDLRGNRGSDLLHFLLSIGADEFTIRVLALADTLAPFADAFEDELGVYEQEGGSRRIVTSVSPFDVLSVVRLWSLNAQSLENLLSFLDDGVFHVPAGPDGWLEDLTVYRKDALVFGTVSHEREGVLVLSPDEHDAVARLNIPSISPTRWSGAISFTA